MLPGNRFDVSTLKPAGGPVTAVPGVVTSDSDEASVATSPGSLARRPETTTSCGAVTLTVKAVRALSVSFSNTVQLGIPVVTAVFGTPGLAILIAIISLRKESGRTHPKLILSFVRQNNSADELAFIREWSQVADKIHITDLHNWAGTLNAKSDVNYPCYRLWLTFTVLWDGRVSLCCADFDGRHILGDLRTSTISEIWNSPAYRAVRRQHLESGGPEICRSCDLPKKDSPLWVGRLL